MVNKEVQYGIQGLCMAIAFFLVIKLFAFFAERDFIVKEKESSFFCGTVINLSTYRISASGIDGKALFSQNCASCHALHKDLTGPALYGVEDRVPDKKTLFMWIRNSEQVLKSKNLYFTSLYETYNKVDMNKFPGLKDAEIEAILDYIKQSGSIVY